MKKKSLKKYFKKPEKYIPNGYYCYNEKGLCPFWDSKKGEYPSQEDGYCHFLGVSDWELNELIQHSSIITRSKNKELEGKTLYEAFGPPTEEDIDPETGKVMHFGSSLLWDQCKECCVNNEPDDEYLDSITVSTNNPEKGNNNG